MEKGILDQQQINATSRAAEALKRIIAMTDNRGEYKEVRAATVDVAGRIVAAMVAARVI